MQGFEYNKNEQGDIFNNMCQFWSWEECSRGKISVSSYIGIDTRKYQYHLLNPTRLEFIAGYIMEEDIVDGGLNNITKQKMNLIDDYITSYCSVLNSPKFIGMIKK